MKRPDIFEYLNYRAINLMNQWQRLLEIQEVQMELGVKVREVVSILFEKAKWSALSGR